DDGTEALPANQSARDRDGLLGYAQQRASINGHSRSPRPRRSQDQRPCPYAEGRRGAAKGGPTTARGGQETVRRRSRKPAPAAARTSREPMTIRCRPSGPSSPPPPVSTPPTGVVITPPAGRLVSSSGCP